MLPNGTCSPNSSGVGATICEGEGVDEGERIRVGEGNAENEFWF